MSVTFLDFIRKVHQEKKARGFIIKGGPGSGWFAPPKGTHVARAKVISRIYKIRGGKTVYVVNAKATVPRNFVNAAQKTKTGIIPATYNAETNTWHMVIADAHRFPHASYAKQVLGRVDPLGYDTQLVRAIWDVRKNLVRITSQITDVGAGELPYKKKRLQNIARRNQEKALKQLFTWRGNKPKLGHAVYNYAKETWEMEAES